MGNPKQTYYLLKIWLDLRLTSIGTVFSHNLPTAYPTAISSDR